MLDKLIARGANINLRDAIGNTSLHKAVGHLLPDIVRYLLVLGAGCEI